MFCFADVVLTSAIDTDDNHVICQLAEILVGLYRRSLLGPLLFLLYLFVL